MIELYGYQFNDQMIRTQYGEISHLEWLQKEKVRIEKDPYRKANIITRKEVLGLTSALFVNEMPDCGCPVCRRLYRKGDEENDNNNKTG